LEDEEGSEEHKLIQIAQAIHKNQPVTITIQGKFQGNQDREWEVQSQRGYAGLPPTDVMSIFEAALFEI
jgi:hypothetical protein